MAMIATAANPHIVGGVQSFDDVVRHHGEPRGSDRGIQRLDTHDRAISLKPTHPNMAVAF